MNESIDKILKHPIKSAIVINASLGAIACTIKIASTSIVAIIKEVEVLCKLFKKGGVEDGK